MLSEDPLGALTNGVGPSGSGGGPGDQIRLQQSVQEQDPAQQNTKPAAAPSRYESQKRRDWNTFGQYLKNHRPPLAVGRCSGNHVLEFLRYLDQFGKTKVHLSSCHFFGLPNPPHPCPCPLRQAWGSLDALIGRLRAAFEENGGKPESNPFGARMVRLYLREVREMQAKARGIAYEKKKRKRPQPASVASSSEHLHPQSLTQAHAQTNPLTGHGYAQHRPVGHDHSKHSQHSQQHSQHSQHIQQQSQQHGQHLQLSHQQLQQHSQHSQQAPQHSQQHAQHSQQSQQHAQQQAPHSQDAQQHSQQLGQHSQLSQLSQHSQHGGHSHLPHPLNTFAPNRNPLSPFGQHAQQLHTSNLLHGYAPSSSPLNPYSQDPNALPPYQDLQLHNHTTAGQLLS